MRHPGCPAAVRARRSFVFTVLVSICPASDAGADSAPIAPLGMADAMELAIEHQPLLEGLEAEARAERESAVAAAQLPDPALVGGLRDWPVTGPDAWSLTRDSDTQIQVGVVQEFPRAEKRRLRGETRTREAARIDAERALAMRTVRRDAALAWLDAWREARGVEIATAALAEAELQARSFDVGLRSGATSQSDLLAATLEVEQRHDELAAAEQALQRARHALSRWLGEAASRPLATDLPPLHDAPDAETVVADLHAHPQVLALRGAVAVADAGAALAQADYLADWSVEVGYGNRPDYSDMFMVQLRMDLPFFTANRQDRELAAALAMREVARTRVEDAERVLVAEARSAREDLRRTLVRLNRFDTAILPQAEALTRAADAAWAAGRGSLDEVLATRRAGLELRAARLDLQRDAVRYRVQLDYLAAGAGADTGALP